MYAASSIQRCKSCVKIKKKKKQEQEAPFTRLSKRSVFSEADLDPSVQGETSGRGRERENKNDAILRFLVKTAHDSG